MDVLALDNTYGPLLQLYMSKIPTMEQCLIVPALIPSTTGRISCPHSLEMITSAILEMLDQDLIYVHIIPVTRFGMVKDVGPTAPAVNSITHHGSREHYHRLPVMTLNCVSAMEKKVLLTRIL